MRVLVVDDEAPARNRLIRLLKAIEDVEIVGEADNGLAALEQIALLSPDLVFLDIEMPELSGLEVAESLGDNRPAIVFATAYDKFALEAFDVAALDYLVKPIAKDRLRGAINKVKRTLQSSPPDLSSALAALRPTDGRIAVRTGSNYEVLFPGRISAVLAEDHYALILSDNRELLSEESLDALAGRLTPHGFLRVHRGAIINLDCVVKLKRLGDRKYVAVLNDQKHTEVPISRDRLPDLKARLNIN